MEPFDKAGPTPQQDLSPHKCPLVADATPTSFAVGLNGVAESAPQNHRCHTLAVDSRTRERGDKWEDTMAIIIDGYNLLNATGIVGQGRGGGAPGLRSLGRSRLALLNFLVEALDLKDVGRTTIVFDAHDPPRGLPSTVRHRGLLVRFASEYDEADTLIEELIQADSAPRQLTVVSSDHRLHRAARRRKAKPVDSDVWFDRIVKRRRERQYTEEIPKMSRQSATPAVPLLSEDVDYWVDRFGGESALAKVIEEELADEETEVLDREVPKRDGIDRPPVPTEPEDKKKALFDEIGNPFPPGYGEDLLEDEPG